MNLQRLAVSPRDRVTVFFALKVLFAVWIVTVIARTVSWRIYMRKLKAQGLPMPPHNLIFGHFLILVRLIRQLPSDAHPALLPDEIRRSFPDLGPNFYLDLVPFADPMLVVGTTDVHHQIAQEHILDKTQVLRNFIRPLTDGLDFLTMDWPHWKKWRALFNPGFSAAHLMTLVPAIAREAEILVQVLEQHAKKQDVFMLKKVTDYLTMDVIGQLVLGTRFDCQRQRSQVVESLRTKIRWFVLGIEANLWTRHNPFQPLVQWYHGRILNAYISEKFDQRVAALNENPDAATTAASSARGTRTIIDMVIKANSQTESTESQLSVDPYFKKVCMSQIKLLLFGGHDTTSSAICYHVYLLSQHPDVLKRVRDEHSAVFGSDPDDAASAIASSPHLVNEIPITTAVIKESLRLFPPVTPSRQGERGYSIKDSQGRSFPTGDFLVFPCTQMIHHDPMYWPEAMSFIPDRWLVGPDDPMYPVKGAWRPFEHGPKNCIAQELAMLEMKIALVMVARRFVFQPAYDEIDMEAGKVSPTVHGEKAYQVSAMQPRNDLPIRVRLAGRAP